MLGLCEKCRGGLKAESVAIYHINGPKEKKKSYD